jgi:hypothetical protein
LRRAGSQPYARETLFIVTADHTHQMQPPDAPPLEIFRVPFYWYIPGQRSGVVEYPAGQMDLLPTLQTLVGDRRPLSTAGQSLFAKTARGAFAYSSAGRRVLWVDRCGGYRVNLQGGQLLPVFAPMSAAWIERCRQPANSRSFARKKALLLAYFQTTRNRLLRNEFSIPAQ